MIFNEGANTVVSNVITGTGNLTQNGVNLGLAANTTAFGSNQDLTYTAVVPGTAANSINITYKNPEIIGAAPNVTVSGNNITVNLGTSNGLASLLVGSGNQALLFTANATNATLDGSNGSVGNGIQVKYVAAIGNGVASSIALTGNAITVTLGTNGTGVVNATAASIATLFGAANASVKGLVTVTNFAGNSTTTGSDATGVLTAALEPSLANLTSGINAGKAASLLTGTNGTNGVALTAKTLGTGNNSLTVTYVAPPSGAVATTTATISGSAITVNLAGPSTGTSNATPAQVVAALAANATINALISAVANGSSAVAAVSSTNLAGGVDTTPNSSALAIMQLLQITPAATGLINPVLAAGSSGLGLLTPTGSNITLGGGSNSQTLTNLTLSGANTFNGTTNIAQGTLTLGNSLALQNSTLSYNNGDGTLSFGTLTAATFGGLTGNRDIALSNGTGALALNVGPNNSNTTYSGNLTGAGSFTKSGTGTLVFAGTNNSYAGGTTIKGGFINFNALGQFGSGQLVLNGGGVQYSAGTTSDVSSILNPTTGLSAGLDTIDTNINNIAFGTVLSGAGELGKAGTGTLTLSLSNNYTAGTLITNGLINFNSLNNFGTATGVPGSNNPGTITLAGGGVQYNGTTVDLSPNLSLGVGLDTIDTGTAATVTFGTSVTGTGTLVKSGSGTLILTTTESYTGGTVINAGTLQLGNGTASGLMNQTLPQFSNILDNGTLQFNQNGSTTYSGIIAGTGNLVQSGANNLTLSAINTFTGSTNITAGTLTLGNSLALQNSTFNFNTGNGNLNFSTLTAVTFGGLSGNKPIGLDNTAGTNSPIIMTVGTNNSNTTYSGALSGNGGLIKVGNGVLTLNGTNTYLGNTVVNFGTLNLASAGALATAGSLINNNATVLNSVGGSLPINNSLSFANNVNFVGNYTFGQAASPGLISLTGNTVLSLSSNSLVFAVNPGNTSLTGANGANGNTVTVRFLNPGANNAAANLSVTGNNIVINLKTDASGNVLSKASDILALIGNVSITNGTAAGNLVSVSLAANSTGSGFLGATPVTNLAGGNATANATLTSTFGSSITINDAIAETGNIGQTFQTAGTGNLTFGGNGTAVVNLTSNINGQHFGVTGNQTVTIGNGANLSVGSLGTAGFNSFGFNAGDNVTVNLSGTGVFNSGNVVVSLGNLGANLGGTNTTLNVSGTSSFTALGLWVGQGSSADDTSDITTSTVNQTGGTILLTGNTSGNGALQMGGQTGYLLGSANVTYNLNGGVLQANSIVAANIGVTGSAIINFNGGVLQAGSNNANYITGFNSTALVDKINGFIFNTNGFNVTFSQNLTHDLTLGATADGGFTKQGAGTFTFPITQNNTFTGATTITGGTLNVSIDSALGANLSAPLNFNGSSTLQLGAGFTLSQNRTINIANGVIATFDTQANTMTFGGNITGNLGSLVKTGSGTLRLFGFNTYKGSTTVNNGTLALDFSSPGAPGSNMISANSSLILNGPGAVFVQGIPTSQTNSQTFNGTTINGGSGIASVTLNGSPSAGGPTINFNFGTLSRTSGGLLDLFTAGNGTYHFTTSSGVSQRKPNGHCGRQSYTVCRGHDRDRN